MVLFACYNLNGSRLKPCFNHKLEFFAVFQLLLLWRSLKKILLVWFQPFGTFTWNAGHTLNAYPKTDVFVCLLLSVAFFECFFLYLIIIQYALFFFFFFSGSNTTSVYLCSLAVQYTVKIAEKSYLQCLPPSVVMSQNTFKELPFFSGSIQYSPSPLESPASKICLQDRAGWREDQPGTAANLNMFYFLVSWFRVNCQIISLWRIVVLCFYPYGPSWSRIAILGQQSNIDMEDVTYLGPFTHAVKRKFLLGIAVLNELWITTHPCMCFCLCFALFFHSQVQ